MIYTLQIKNRSFFRSFRKKINIIQCSSRFNQSYYVLFFIMSTYKLILNNNIEVNLCLIKN